MFKKNMVVSIKSNGRFLRESGNDVRMPFGSEYSLYFKNLEPRKAIVTITIDGKDILSGNKLIVSPDSVLELDGYLDGTVAKNRFKFIQMTDQIEEHRGIDPEDGLITIWFDYEVEQLTSPVYHTGNYIPSWWVYPTYPYPPYTITTATTWTSDNTTLTGGGKYVSSSGRIPASGLNSAGSFFSSASLSSDDYGFTVKGSDIHQQFGIGYTRELEGKPSIMTFKIHGYDETDAKRAIFTNDKIECPTCGLKSKNTYRHCPQCGTRLGV